MWTSSTDPSTGERRLRASRVVMARPQTRALPRASPLPSLATSIPEGRHALPFPTNLSAHFTRVSIATSPPARLRGRASASAIRARPVPPTANVVAARIAMPPRRSARPCDRATRRATVRSGSAIGAQRATEPPADPCPACRRVAPDERRILAGDVAAVEQPQRVGAVRFITTADLARAVSVAKGGGPRISERTQSTRLVRVGLFPPTSTPARFKASARLHQYSLHLRPAT